MSPAAADGLGWLSDRQRDGGIDRIPLPPGLPGTLWLCGKHAIARRFDAGAWDTVVSLVERHEIADHYPDYAAWLDRAGERAIWHPIHDLHAPTLSAMRDLVARVTARLRAGDRVVMHCAAGKGRAGTTAVCLLVGAGLSLDDALATVAGARPGAGPEAGVQRDLVAAFASSGSSALCRSLLESGVAIARGVLDVALVDAWRRAADDWYADVDAAVARVGPWRVAEVLDVRFAPTACSLGLEVLGADDVVGELRDALDGVVRDALGGPTRALVESSWIRRQRPPHLAPEWHAPHSWHQDGALGLDFSAAASGLLPMVTCWCPLVPCGTDAPGIAYVAGRRAELMMPDALASQHAPVDTAVLAPGDVLVMMGDLLHRTHSHAGMTGERVSVEVRFVPAERAAP